MMRELSPLMALQSELDSRVTQVSEVAKRYLARANGNASRNTYLHLDPDEVLERAAALEERYPPGGYKPALFGVPVSLKDCFDVAGTGTTCGSRFYARRNGVAERDSAVAERVEARGCLLMGKTHLHPLAYGITGQNAEYGDCLQPRDAGALTGGSSSGAAASVQEGSAVAAIGTDTGGSIRVPAALCGLVGFRCSRRHGTPDGAWPEMWRGGTHLAPLFDTLGLLFEDVRDARSLVGGLVGVESRPVSGTCRIGWVSEKFLFDAEPDVLDSYRRWRVWLERAGAVLTELDVDWWEGSTEIFAAIQAQEAAKIHQGHFEEFEEGIALRLRSGASPEGAMRAGLSRKSREEFYNRMDCLIHQNMLDLTMLPCAPVSRLAVGVDAGAVRQKILRYTTPFSLMGMAAMALPGELLGGGVGTGVQLAASGDGLALGWLDWIAKKLN